MAFTSASGARIHWQEQGTGTPLLLIMGAAYSSNLWYPAIGDLATRHRVIWFDNRGTGESQATPVASISDMAADAAAVLDAAGVDKAHVYGVSLGGVVAQQFALENPERTLSLVLGCTGILTADKPRAPKALRLFLYLPRSLRLAIGKKGSYGPACPPDKVVKDQAVLRADKTDKVGLIAQQDALRAYSVTHAQIAGLTMPALVLHGTTDSVVKPEWGAELARTLPHARLVTYEGAGHNFLVAAGDQANAEVLAFLAGVST